LPQAARHSRSDAIIANISSFLIYQTLKVDYAQVLQQDFYPQQHQNYSSQQLCLVLQLRAEPVAYGHSGKGDDKGGNADDGGGADDFHPEKGKGYAHRQRVDAGGDGKNEKLLYIKAGGFLLTAPDGLDDHLAADEAQQTEGNPVVDAGYIALKLPPQKPAQAGHQRLEPAEEKSDYPGLTEIEFSHAQALANGNGKGVHGKTYAD